MLCAGTTPILDTFRRLCIDLFQYEQCYVSCEDPPHPPLYYLMIPDHFMKQQLSVQSLVHSMRGLPILLLDTD